MTVIDLRPCDDCPPVAAHQPAARHPTLDLLGEAVRRVLYTFGLWRKRVRERNELAGLDERSLADIGLTPGDRDFLVNKPFWRE